MQRPSTRLLAVPMLAHGNYSQGCDIQGTMVNHLDTQSIWLDSCYELSILIGTITYQSHSVAFKLSNFGKCSVT